jgi:hypothetical protein
MRPTFFFVIAWLAAAPVFAQGPLPTGTALVRAQAALEALDPDSCGARLSAETVRLAIVVHPDGGWALAIGPIAERTPIDPAAVASLRSCLEGALVTSLGPTLARPPRRVAAVTRTWLVGVVSVGQRIAAAREAIQACVFEDLPAATTRVSARIRIDHAPDGSARITPRGRSPEGALLARCLATALGELPGGLASFDQRVVSTRAPTPVPPPEDREPVERHDGAAGAICGWGQRRSDWESLPRPLPCRAGLTCCASGGAAGSDSVCSRASGGGCPMYP